MSTTLYPHSVTLLVFYFLPSGEQSTYDYGQLKQGELLPEYCIVIPLPDLSDERRRKIAAPVHDAYLALKRVATLEGVGSEAFGDFWNSVKRDLINRISEILRIPRDVWKRLTGV